MRWRRWLVLLTVALALSLIMFGPEVMSARLDIQHVATFRCMRRLKIALSHVGRDCGGIPVPSGKTIALGDNCDTPGKLVKQLVTAGELTDPIVCDAFGRPYLLRGLASAPEGTLPLAAGSTVAADCRARYGEEWSHYYVLLSLGSDGKESGRLGLYDHATADADVVTQGFADGAFYLVSGLSGRGSYGLVAGGIAPWVWRHDAHDVCRSGP